MVSSNKYNPTELLGFKRICLPHQKELDLPFYVITFGIAKDEIKVDWEEAAKSYLVYSISGCGRAYIDGKWVDMPEGSLLYIPPQLRVQYEPIDENRWSTAYITFSGKFAESILPQKPFVIEGDHSYIYDAVNSLYEKYGQEDFYESVGSELYYILLKLRRLTGNSRSLSAYGQGTKGDVLRSLKHITEQFTQDLSVSQLAETCGVSEEYYCKVFKRLVGTTPVSHINSLRITRACDMLSKDPSRRIEEIAKDCGFNYISYFNRVFKKETGVSPRVFREKSKT